MSALAHTQPQGFIASASSNSQTDGLVGPLSTSALLSQPTSDLELTQTASRDLEFNRYMLYTIKVRNLGPDGVANVFVFDGLSVAPLGAPVWIC